jgi:lipopolysaccharide transport system ATP-binding protein
MSPSIIVTNLSKRYKLGELHRKATFRHTLGESLRNYFKGANKETFWALRDVSFLLQKGEILGIIGRNGAGKSTLLKLLSKITYPTVGKISVNGRIASLLEVGTGFHDELTGRENIFLNGSILGMKKKEICSKLEEIIDFSGVERFIDTPVKHYSSGMRLRLGFSVAAHLEAEILLVDEILAVGDAEFQKKCLGAMGDLRGSGRTVLFVSHQMVAIESLCSRVIWLENGQVCQDGQAREIVINYLSTFANALIAEGADLKTFKHRKGNGEVKFTKLEFLQCNGEKKSLFRCGDPLIARLYYLAEKTIQNPHFGFELHTDSGIKATSINTWSSGFEIPCLSPGSGYIEFEVPSLNLLPGRFYVTLWLSGTEIGYDELDHCAVVDIEPSDFYGSGRILPKEHSGLVILPCKWNLNGSCREVPQPIFAN